MSEPSSPKIELDLERAVPPSQAAPPLAVPPVARPMQPRPYVRPYDLPPIIPGDPSYRVLGLRLAGVVVAANVGMSLWSMSKGNNVHFMLGSVVVDAIIAPFLLLGQESVRKWALWRSWMGLIVGSLWLAFKVTTFAALAIAISLNVLYCGGLALLLLGEELGLGRLIAGASLSGVPMVLVLVVMGLVNAATDREPSPQTAFAGRFSVLGFAKFKASPQSLRKSSPDELEIETSASLSGQEAVWRMRPRSGVVLDPERVLRASFQGLSTELGATSEACTVQAESHGIRDGQGLAATITVNGKPRSVRMFFFLQGDTYWEFLVLVPTGRESLAARILDSIEVGD